MDDLAYRLEQFVKLGTMASQRDAMGKGAEKTMPMGLMPKAAAYDAREIVKMVPMLRATVRVP